MRRERPSAAACAALCWLLCAAARAQSAPAAAATSSLAPSNAKPEAPGIASYVHALEQARLAPAATTSALQLRALVARGEKLYLEGAYDEAAILLMEAVDSPRFADFRDFPEFAAGEYMAGSALSHLGSLKTARGYLERSVARGTKSSDYGPSVRAYVDVALRLGDFAPAADWLEGATKNAPSESTQGEIAYLRARAAYDGGDAEGAARLFTSIGKRSRFYANAQYFLGAIAARKKEWHTAEQRFCAVATQGVEDHYSFFVDQRFFGVQDLARLALGRTAHEQQRGDDAFYYYFQVPNDSPRLAEALFEAAYASYEAKQHDTALDLLDQLEARFPQSAFVAEAAILRGYVALARCDFERADRYFAEFSRHFTPLLAEVDRLLANPLRRETLYEQLIAAEAGKRENDAERRTLLALIRVDPDFYRLQAELADLDAESARAGRLSDSISATLIHVQGGDRPRSVTKDATPGEAEALERELALALGMARGLGDQVDALRAAGAKANEVSAREAEVAALSARLSELSERARVLRAKAEDKQAEEAAQGQSLAALLASDVALARKLPGRAAELRTRLARAASARAEQALRELRKKLFGLLQRSRIGRIDAVMGSKRRIEVQIESLAAGRFPPELRDPLAVQGLLADDEEYWPFEGEDWPDEYKERYDAEDEGEVPEAEPQAPAPRPK